MNVERAPCPGRASGDPMSITGEGDLVEVIYAPAETSLAMLRQQVMNTVVLPGMRRLLGRFSSPR